MNQDLRTILALRRVLQSAKKGMGMGQSLVRELQCHESAGTETARLLLLGFPLSVALQPLIRGKSEEVSMLASLIVTAPRSSTALVGASGEALAGTLERWVKARENTRLENRVFRFRSLLTSGVLGAVTAMIASLGPVVANLNFENAPAAGGGGSILYAAAGFAAMAAGMLGLLMSGRGFYVNVAVALGVFALVSALASPVASVQPISLWGVK